MSETKKEKVLSELHNDVVARIADFNDALKANDISAMNKADSALKEAEAKYAECKATEVYDRLMTQPNPMLAAITEYSYLVLSHHDDKKNGVIIERTLVDDKIRQIDLLKFCRYAKLDEKWNYAVERYNQLLCMRAARELKFTPAQIKEIAKSFFMQDISRKIDLGETSDSNTAMVKQLQSVLDGIILVPDEKGKNTYRVNNHDIAYLLMCYTKKGKSALSVAVAKHDFFRRLMGDIAHRVVTGMNYSLEFQMVKAKEKATGVATPPATTAPATKPTEKVA